MKIPRFRIQSLAAVRDKPEKTALAFAVGVLVGFSPLFGRHLILGLAVALIFRLNKVAVMMGVLTNTPWLSVPFYTFSSWLGIELLGLPSGLSAPQVGYPGFLAPEFWEGLFSQWTILIPVFVGSTALSVVLAALSYPAVLYLLKRFSRRASGGNGSLENG